MGSKFIQTFQLQRNFPTSKEAFQLRSVLSNFTRFFPTSIGSFQFLLALSNFSETFQLKTFQLLVLPNCPFQLHVSQKMKLITRYSGFFVWILFPEMTLGDAPKTNFSKFSWILFPKMTL